jgi:2-oxoisovalerate dehydrogenase E1 component alpha subunit
MIRAARSLSMAPQLFRRGIANIPPHGPAQPLSYLPTSQSPIVSKLHFFNSVTADGAQIPTYRVLDGLGKLIDGAELPEVCSAFEEIVKFAHGFVD